MGKILILSEYPEIRELLSQEFAAEGHVVIATGNPGFIQELFWDFDPDLLLIDFHLNKGNPWQMMQEIRKDYPRMLVLPYTAYPGFDGNIRLVFAHPEGGKNLTLQAFKRQLDSFMSPGFIPGDGKSVNYGSHEGSETGRRKFFSAPPAETASPFDDLLDKSSTQK